MYKPTKNTLIDMNDELEHMIEYVSLSWPQGTPANPSALRELITGVWNATQQEAKYWHQEYLIDERGLELMKMRTDQEAWKKANPTISTQEIQLVYKLDALYQFSTEFIFALSSISEASRKDWSYSRLVSKEIKEFKSLNKDYKKLQPLNYVYSRCDYKNVPEDFTSLEYQEACAQNFKGVNSDGASHGGFSNTIAAHNIIYSHAEQGRDPLQTFVGAIITHALFVISHNNTVELKKALDVVYTDLLSPSHYQGLIPKVDLTLLTQNPLLCAYQKAQNELYIELTPTEYKNALHFGVLMKLPIESLSEKDKKELDAFKASGAPTGLKNKKASRQDLSDIIAAHLFSSPKTKQKPKI